MLQNFGMSFSSEALSNMILGSEQYFMNSHADLLTYNSIGSSSHKMNLVLVDTNKAKLDEAEASLKQSSSGTVKVHEMDVSSISDWSSLADQLKQSSTSVDFLHLNAGIGLKSDWTDNSYFHKIFDTNFFGVVNGINVFYPQFSKSDGGRKAIVITGSKQGITNPPGNPAYNASKAALKSLTEHLAYDLSKAAPSTSVHLLVPGWTFTGLTGGGKTTTKPDGAWSPDQVADYMYQKINDGKAYIICPDNDVDEVKDKKRMLWTAGDIIYDRQPMSRWRSDVADQVENQKL